MYNSGLCYAELDDYAKAKDCFNKVIAVDPNYAYAYYALAMAYETENNVEKAILNYEKFVSISTDNDMNSQVKKQIEYLKSKK